MFEVWAICCQETSISITWWASSSFYSPFSSCHVAKVNEVASTMSTPFLEVECLVKSWNHSTCKWSRDIAIASFDVSNFSAPRNQNSLLILGMKIKNWNHYLGMTQRFRGFQSVSRYVRSFFIAWMITWDPLELVIPWLVLEPMKAISLVQIPSSRIAQIEICIGRNHKQRSGLIFVLIIMPSFMKGTIPSLLFSTLSSIISATGFR